MTSDDAALVREIQELYEKATKGPWQQQLFYKPGAGWEPYNYVVQDREQHRTIALCSVDNERAHKDAALIVALVNAWPTIAALLRREWIPVSERLPRPLDTVAVLNDGIERTAGFLGTKKEWHLHTAAKVNVTHWQPLPDAPTGSQP